MASRWPLALTSLRRLLDRLSLYLPILLTGVLALGSYWLVRNAPRLGQPAQAQALTHDPDYFMRGFSVKGFFPDGRLRTELIGQEGRHYPDSETLEVDKMRLLVISPDGLRTRASADRGLSNADGSEIQLFGNAVVIREPIDKARSGTPRMEFRGEFLHAFVNTEQVLSNQPVLLIRGHDRFSADSLHYDHLHGIATLQGRVRGQLTPSNPASGEATPAR